MNVQRNIILSMVISGALAGLGGATLYVGYASNMQIGVLPSHGFDGIARRPAGIQYPHRACSGRHSFSEFSIQARVS